MSDKIIHPGLILEEILIESGITQRELASKINIAHSLLNNILKGNRNINVNIASHGPCGLKIECGQCQDDADAHDWKDLVTIIKREI